MTNQPLTAEQIVRQYDSVLYETWAADLVKDIEAYAAQQNAVAEGQVKVLNMLLDRANTYIGELEAENERLKQQLACKGDDYNAAIDTANCVDQEREELQTENQQLKQQVIEAVEVLAPLIEVNGDGLLNDVGLFCRNVQVPQPPKEAT
jgi:hypothetical protein